MRYVMILLGDESKWFDPELGPSLMEEVGTWWQKWFEAGKIVQGGAELGPSSGAKTIGAGPDGTSSPGRPRSRSSQPARMPA